MLSPRLPPSARARGSRPQLQDRKRSGGERGPGRRRVQEEREGARRKRSQEEREGARRVEHNTGIHTQCPRRTPVGPCSLPSRETHL